MDKPKHFLIFKILGFVFLFMTIEKQKNCVIMVLPNKFHNAIVGIFLSVRDTIPFFCQYCEFDKNANSVSIGVQ